MKIHEKILDNLDEIIYLIDKDMNIIFANKSIENFGIKKNKILGKKLYEIFPFLKEKEYEKIFINGKTTRRGKWIEYNGKKMYMVIIKTPILNNGKVQHIITIMRDLTELKKKEEKLKEITAKYEKIFEIAQEGIYIEDEDGKIIFANNAFAKMIGYNINEIIGKKIFDFLDEKGKKIIRNNRLSKARYELKIYSKDGYPKTILVSSSPLFRNKNYYGGVYLNLDITQRKKAEEERKILLERERNFRLKTAHYFFNPLAIAKGYMGLMIEEVEEREREKVMKAINAINRIESVIKNIVTKGEIAE